MKPLVVVGNFSVCLIGLNECPSFPTKKTKQKKTTKKQKQNVCRNLTKIVGVFGIVAVSAEL